MAEPEELLALLKAGAVDGLVPSATIAAAIAQCSVSAREVEDTALRQGLLPARYQRNQRALTTEHQLQLFQARVAVIGCGGLGGYVIEQLARVGVGQLVAVDPDVFEDHNLNRQLLATSETLGRSKAEAAAQRVATVNPAVEVTVMVEEFALANSPLVLAGVTVAVDGLDSIPARQALATACAAANIPLVHGAVAGWYGRVATQVPGDKTIERLYPGAARERGVEVDLGVLPCAAAAVASVQVAEVIKLIVAEGSPLRRRCLTLDLREGEAAEIAFAPLRSSD